MEVLIELKARMLSSDFCLIAMQELQYGTSALSTTSVYSESLFAILHNLLNRDEETFMRQRQANCGIDNLTLDSNEVNIRLQLTPRRCEILELLSQGLLYKEISSTLGITLGTVKQHVHKIYHTLQVSNKIEAVNLYREHS